MSEEPGETASAQAAARGRRRRAAAAFHLLDAPQHKRGTQRGIASSERVTLRDEYGHPRPLGLPQDTVGAQARPPAEQHDVVAAQGVEFRSPHVEDVARP